WSGVFVPSIPFDMGARSILVGLVLAILAQAAPAGAEVGGGLNLESRIGAVGRTARSLTATGPAVPHHDSRRHQHPAIHHPADLPMGAEQPEDRSAFRRRNLGRTRARGAGITNSGGTIGGQAFIPLLLVDFDDNRAETDLHTPNAYQNMLFSKDYPHGAGSMRDYFLDQSGGTFEVDGQVSSWARMPGSYGTYVGNSYGYQTNGYNSQTLVEDAVRAHDGSMDFCRGDTDGDSYVDVIYVVHAGSGAEETRWGLWSLKWALNSDYVTNDTCANGQRARISTFVIEPEEYETDRYTAPGAPDRMTAIGMFVHEFGHVLGLPDLYDTDNSSPGGVGTWDPMASGAWGFDGAEPWRPVPYSAWSKMKVGWARPQVVTNDSVDLGVPSIDAAHTGVFDGVYKLVPNGNTGTQEYFLVENRQPVRWAAGFPSGGLLIWHVDDSRRENNDEARRAVTLVQADGRDELGWPGQSFGKGDGGDIFPGGLNVRAVNGSTNPSTDLYSGENSKVALESIGNPGPVLKADFLVSDIAATPPEPPRDLTAKLGPAGNVALKWTPSPTGEVTAYRLYRSDYSDEGFTRIGSVERDVLAFTDTDNLTGGETYYYRVRAYARTESSDSNTAEFVTPEAQAPTTPRLSPSSLKMLTGSLVSGAVGLLAALADDPVVVRSVPVARGQKLDYIAVTNVPEGSAQGKNVLILDVAAASEMNAKLKLYDSAAGDWFTLGQMRVAPDAPVHLQLAHLHDWITKKGKIKLRLTATGSTTIKHSLDQISIRFRV
ncbi:MAG: M6 family metalloprotease domain-containing protein, partial [Actinomycetota bacterium]